MTLSASALALDTFVPMLRSLAHVIDKGTAHVTAQNGDGAALAKARLAPDMVPLWQQVQLACHHAKDATARLTGREPAQPASVEENLIELTTRIQGTIDELLQATARAFEGADEREIVIPLSGGEMAFEMTGAQFLRDWALPHFYFHVVTAYDILRHNGVDIGKRDYLTHAGRYIRPLLARSNLRITAEDSEHAKED